MTHAIGHIVQELTKGKPYVFVIMSFTERWSLYERIKRIVEDEFDLTCIRADDAPGSGFALLEIVHLLIDRTELLVADISDLNANVFYELGYAVGNQKSLLLLAEEGGTIPTDLKGKEVIEYRDTRAAMGQFDDQFRRHLRIHIGSGIGLLRDMLEAEDAQPAYIVASPKYPSKEGRHRLYDYQTFGDNLGIVGLLTAFGSIMGEGREVELISAQYQPPGLIEKDLNLYLIGSKKSNPVTGTMLKKLQQGKEPNWYLGRTSKEREVDDYPVKLYLSINGEQEHIDGEMEGHDEGIVHKMDHGIIVRGPHPHHPNRIVLIMAGPHSLGTGAACLAATRTPLIRNIRDKLPEGILADKKQTFWVLVKGEADKRGMLDESGVTILKAGTYE